MSSTILRINNLKKAYNKGPMILKGISTEFQQGEFVVVIGPSGAGKSTFIRCINRMIEPSGGEIVFDGVHMESLSGRQARRHRSDIGMIFQHYNLVDRVNVIKNVLHGRLGKMNALQSLFGLYSQEDRRAACDLLKKVGLQDQMYKRADALSGGQMQRVGICRAILQNPKLLLADEPIASLDPKSAKIVMDQMKAITEEKNLTCIVNLHQVDFARQYASRIIGIQDGQIVFDGPPAALSEDMIAAIYKGKEEQMTLPEQDASAGVPVYA